LRADTKSKGAEGDRRKRGEREDETVAPTKPSGSVSLFDFVQSKLPPQNGEYAFMLEHESCLLTSQQIGIVQR